MTASYPGSIWDGDSGSRDSDDGVNASPTWQDWIRVIEEMQAVQQHLDDLAHDGEGDVNIYPGLSAVELGTSAAHKTIFTFAAMVMDITDAGAAGAHGSIKLYTFTDGHANTTGADMEGTLAAGSGGIANNAVLDIGVGSVTTDTANETLANTEQNITTKDDVTLTGGSKAFAATNLVLVDMDGETAIYLNVAIENASSTADDTLTINGTFTLLWSNHHG
jgi:hypothetical protein